MAQRRHHYDQAFEKYLRERRIPYVAVNEARRALFGGDGPALRATDEAGATRSLKSFDFVIYGPERNLLLEVKGRKIAYGASTTARLESWVTMDDVSGLERWERLFGEGFEAALAFLYWCEAPPPDGLFQEMVEHRGRWYAVRAVRVSEYARHMVVRSPRWRTVHVPGEAFVRISQPLSGAMRSGEGGVP
ncbi:MAG: HYExAFE family protein [Phycisphaerales bacterium]|jgi:hypothetical protein|nr:HYExAFE family protein [Phycisphaerales bacterium]